ncbi:hypothetical protein O4H53_03925 [Sulfitobacter sp. G21635-S1]|uniref:hypothetical protein n=1 Tax=Sulfitobacter sp. G21635-S1 TaxID=3014043 RepID=UPI0022AF4707|nr:hypothetical protein [Sulfitobacter sp. G21635-S1]MCZ4254675.1 hypothetical protein [Sulfitobacter sp. G21635-S1]
MTTPLTALERDLLACVERLVTACEVSAKELSGLEERSTTRIEKELAGLKDCVALLIRSQAASMKALNGLLNDEASYKTLDESLQQSLTLAKAAAERLRDS